LWNSIESQSIYGEEINIELNHQKSTLYFFPTLSTLSFRLKDNDTNVVYTEYEYVHNRLTIEMIINNLSDHFQFLSKGDIKQIKEGSQ